jgi:3'-phosphoadenosine 5'-phosphosulfate sulfotransferase (PAPS reductase)/FAD synthetase
MTKHIVCYSGGHSSALVAIEVVKKYGKGDVILLNHDIKVSSEGVDIKRFKQEVADYLKLPITYANHLKWDEKDQFDVCIDAKAFKVGNGTALCTNRLKTQPFEKYLKEFHADKDCIIYYGFDANEGVRIQRRIGHLGGMGYKTDYPLALWKEHTITSTRQIGIEPPNTYEDFKHANCVGCLKAGQQHWYIVYMKRKDIWEKAKKTEEIIDYTIMKKSSLTEIEPFFKKMCDAGITTTEHENPMTFFARVRKIFKELEVEEEDVKPCECVF